jgi:UDPglucose 6-dehydrogenase
MKMAIVGHGFVGKAVDFGFNNPACEKFIVDPKGGLDITELEKHDINVTFVCVPTPMGKAGDIDSSIIEQCVDYLKNNVTGLIIIKSTVTPDIIKKLTDKQPRIIYNPEFLTEKSANEDFVNPIMHVFGGSPDYTKQAENLYTQYSLCKPCPVFHMSTTDASFVKYGINSFLASKVLWFNQFYDIVSAFDGNYGKIISAIGADKRVSPSHTSVPGFDGKRGFAGACFPKDSYAFSMFARNLDTDFTVLEEVIKQNNEYRRVYELDAREKEQNVSFDHEL